MITIEVTKNVWTVSFSGLFLLSISGTLRSMDNQGALRFHQKYLNLHQKYKQMSQGSGMT